MSFLTGEAIIPDTTEAAADVAAAKGDSDVAATTEAAVGCSMELWK